MLRLETETGWWLVTHPDHAHLAAAFAERWGNEQFKPETEETIPPTNRNPDMDRDDDQLPPFITGR